MLNFIQWSACLTSLLGALLVALNNHLSKWAFWAFLVANVLWIVFAIAIKNDALMVTQIGFILTSLLGIYKWFFMEKKVFVSPKQVT